MTWKQIEQSREARLWLKEVVVPIAGFVTAIFVVPETREIVTENISKLKQTISKKFKKEES